MNSNTYGQTVPDIKSLSMSLQLLFETLFSPRTTYPITLEMSSEEQKVHRAKYQLFVYEFSYNMMVLAKVSEDSQYKI